jgi:hypothetical protein
MERPMRLWLSRKDLKLRYAESSKSNLLLSDPKEDKPSLLEENLERSLLFKAKLFLQAEKKVSLLLKPSKIRGLKV